MIVCCNRCSCVFDDAQTNTVCPHYPVGAGPAAYCKTHDLFRPCAVCEVPPMARANEFSPADADRYLETA